MSSDTCLQELVSPSPVTKASVESFHNHSSRGEFTNPSEFRSRAAEIQEITIIHKGFEMSNSSLVSRGPSQFLRGEAISLKWPIKIQWRLQWSGGMMMVRPHDKASSWFALLGLLCHTILVFEECLPLVLFDINAHTLLFRVTSLGSTNFGSSVSPGLLSAIGRWSQSISSSVREVSLAGGVLSSPLLVPLEKAVGYSTKPHEVFPSWGESVAKGSWRGGGPSLEHPVVSRKDLQILCYQNWHVLQQMELLELWSVLPRGLMCFYQLFEMLWFLGLHVSPIKPHSQRSPPLCTRCTRYGLLPMLILAWSYSNATGEILLQMKSGKTKWIRSLSSLECRSTIFFLFLLIIRGVLVHD
ncbi:hypothetical protein M9H77_03949 [Catharanthus roseus]|uniref:Uncharacterized protein n=1 Tax=Catharanthus roseus TaxID=4058 RepID=A0ACC0CD66_CATRO|nr:hypothetical protein M9H77_03949 [Catharanthus roseus]